jgi:hypothetical protein
MDLHCAVRTFPRSEPRVLIQAIRQGWEIARDTVYGFIADEAPSESSSN